MSRLVLLTGATGFAGSHVLEALLAAGHRVRIPVRPQSRLAWIPSEGVERVPGDLRDPDCLASLVSGASWIFHFGGITRAGRRGDFERINTQGTCDLFDAACAAGDDLELFLFCSSLAAGGPAPSPERPRREEDPAAPISAYGRSKLEAERCLSQRCPSRTRLVMIRPPTVYGPRDTALLVLFRWLAHGILPMPAPKGSLASLIHARDLAQASLHLAETRAKGLFYVGDGKPHSWEEVGSVAGGILGKPAHPLRIPSPLVRLPGIWGELVTVCTGRAPVINLDKVRDLLQPYWIVSIDRLLATGYAPRVDLAGGLRETVDWYRAEGWL